MQKVGAFLCADQMDDTYVAALIQNWENYTWDVFGSVMGLDPPKLNNRVNNNDYFVMK